MTIDQAIHELWEQYYMAGAIGTEKYSWVQSIGKATDKIVIFTKFKNHYNVKKAKKALKDGYKGFPVEFKYIGKVETK